MRAVLETSAPQDRWNRYGAERISDMRAHPERYLLTEAPEHAQEVYRDLLEVLGSFRGCQVLEMGSGFGQLSVFLACQGVTVTGVDVGTDLVAAARLLAQFNGAACTFHQCSVVEMPFPPHSFDAVIGASILHHLSESDLTKALQEAHRVLKDGGVAVFYEPVENSRVFDLLQNLVPVGRRGSPDYRPSILQRRAWRAYIRASDDRALTNRELIRTGRHFRAVRIEPHDGPLRRLDRVIGERYWPALMGIDRFILRTFPPVRFLSRTVRVEYLK